MVPKTISEKSLENPYEDPSLVKGWDHYLSYEVRRNIRWFYTKMLKDNGVKDSLMVLGGCNAKDAIEYARLGIEKVISVDASHSMTEAAVANIGDAYAQKGRYSGMPLIPELTEIHARQLDWKTIHKTFSNLEAIIQPEFGVSLNPNLNDLAKNIRAVYKTLKPGGMYLLDGRFFINLNLEPSEYTKPSSPIVLNENGRFRISAQNVSQYIYNLIIEELEGGNKFVHTVVDYFNFIPKLLVKAGFGNIGIHFDYRYRSDDNELTALSSQDDFNKNVMSAPQNRSFEQPMLPDSTYFAIVAYKHLEL